MMQYLQSVAQSTFSSKFHRSFLFILLPALLLCLVVGTGHAQQNTQQQAQQAYRSGQYQQALALYQQLNQSSSSFNSQYNQAICHYKLQQWPKALAIFQQLHEQKPEHEVVQLNLALTLAQKGETQLALEHFDWLSLAASSDTIANLALKNYTLLSEQEALEQAQTAKSSEQSTWFLSASVGYGHDDNVISVLDDTATTSGDTFWESTVSVAWLSSPDFNNAWVIDTSYYTSSYDEASSYDVDILSASVKKHFSLGQNQRLSFSLRADETQLGGADYLRSYYLELSNRHKLSDGHKIKYGIRYQQIDEQDIRFTPQSGHSIRFYGQYDWYQNHHRVTLRYRHDQDDRHDKFTEATKNSAATFISYSASRNDYHFGWRYQPGDWYSKVFIRYRESQYDTPHQFSDGTSKLRVDDKLSGGLLLGYEATEQLEFELAWDYTDNRSSIEIYTYEQTMLAASLFWSY